MRKEIKQAIIGVAVLSFLVLAVVFFVGSAESENLQSPGVSFSSRDSLFSFSSDSSSPSVGWTDPNHNSIPTKMSLQGKVTDFNGGLVNNASLGVKISDTNSCSNNVFYDYTFPNLIQSGFFTVLLGQNELLKLNYNQDYFMCLYVNGQLLSGPQVFRGGQGEVHPEQLFDGNVTNPFDFNYFRGFQYQCVAAPGGSCMTMSAGRYAFATSPGSGLAFNNSPRGFSFDLSGEHLMIINAAAENLGMFSFKTRITDPVNGLAAGKMYVRDFQNSVDGNQLMIRNAQGNFVQVGSHIVGDSSVSNNLNLGNTINWRASGSNPCVGKVAISVGSASVNVSTSCVTANSYVFLTQQDSNVSAGNVWVSSRTEGYGFTISTTDTITERAIAWMIINPQ